MELIKIVYFLKCSLFQLHSQHEDNLERGRDGGREGGPSHQERLRDHQELRQQVLVLTYSHFNKDKFKSNVNMALFLSGECFTTSHCNRYPPAS